MPTFAEMWVLNLRMTLLPSALFVGAIMKRQSTKKVVCPILNIRREISAQIGINTLIVVLNV